jgi:hypothetical protein
VVEDYMLPDEECMKYIDGDTWEDEKAKKFTVDSGYDPNGQFGPTVGHLGPGGLYFDSFVMSGKKVYWNQANRDSYESAEGEFSDDCQQITARYYKPGEDVPYSTRIITFLHQGGE